MMNDSGLGLLASILSSFWDGQNSESFDRDSLSCLSEIGGELFSGGMRKVENVSDDFETGEGNLVLATDPREGGAFHVFELGAVLEENFEVALGVVEGVSSRKSGGGEFEFLPKRFLRHAQRWGEPLFRILPFWEGGCGDRD